MLTFAVNTHPCLDNMLTRMVNVSILPSQAVARGLNMVQLSSSLSHPMELHSRDMASRGTLVTPGTQGIRVMDANLRHHQSVIGTGIHGADGCIECHESGTTRTLLYSGPQVEPSSLEAFTSVWCCEGHPPVPTCILPDNCFVE